MVIEQNGIRLHYEVVGTGAPLLWLHGFFGSGADGAYVFPETPSGYQLIAPDLRGHGASTNPANVFSFREAARDVLGLLRHLGVEQTRGIGVSGGGIVLLHMAVMAPEAVAAMVVVSAPPYFPAATRAIQRQTSEAMFGEAELELMRRRHAGGDRQFQDLLAQSRALADDYEDVSFTPPQLGTVKADTLVVFGDRDPLYPVSLALDLHAAVPRSHLWIVPNGGHSPVFQDRAAAFRQTALEFLGGEWAIPEGSARG